MSSRSELPIPDAARRRYVVLEVSRWPEASGRYVGGLLKSHAIPDDPADVAELARTDIPRQAFYLLRPDGHVGLCGTRPDSAAVSDYSARQLRAGVVG